MWSSPRQCCGSCRMAAQWLPRFPFRSFSIHERLGRHSRLPNRNLTSLQCSGKSSRRRIRTSRSKKPNRPLQNCQRSPRTNPHLSPTPARRLSERPIWRSPQPLRGAAIRRTIRQSNANSLPHQPLRRLKPRSPAPPRSDTSRALPPKRSKKVGLGTRVTAPRKERDWIKVKVNTSGNVGDPRKEYLAAVHSLR